MALRRYSRAPILKGGKQYGSSRTASIIFNAAERGSIRVNVRTAKHGERLDAIAGKIYGDGRLWWIIAAASGIGWGLQVPPGTRIVIPTDISQVIELVG